MSDQAATLSDQAATLRIVHLEKYFRRERGSQVAAIDDVSFELAPGKMVAVLGPSGCGKTTMLRCIAGLETPTGGEIWSGNRLLSSGAKGIIVPPERRDFGMMFQSYAVWPHMSVYQNVAYPLKVRRRPRAEIKQRVSRILEVVGIAHLRDEYSSHLSGGQQQRIALARCLVNNPNVILFDEPLSNVDAKVREELRVELLAMQRRLGFAGVYVTHDQEEAMSIADEVMVMQDGKAVQMGSPEQVYHTPNSRFVAGFVGIINEWTGTLSAQRHASGGFVISSDIGDVVISESNLPTGSADSASANGSVPVSIFVRPEALKVVDPGTIDAPTTNVWRGVVREKMFRGGQCDCFIDVAGHLYRVRSAQDLGLEIDANVAVHADPQQVRALRIDSAASPSPAPLSHTEAVIVNLEGAGTLGAAGDSAVSEPVAQP